jgi:hypothetical protein
VTPYKHGLSGYVKHSCRCPPCRSAYSTYKRTWRASKAAVLLPGRFDFALLRPHMAGSQAWQHASGRRLSDWNRHGIPWTYADEICCSLGMHPYEVFGPAWFEDGESVEEMA